MNSTGIYSTYNATYAAYAYNQTQPAIDILNTTYGSNWYNHTLATYNTWNTAWLANETVRVNFLNATILANNASWLSTYNATYDAYQTSLNTTYNATYESQINVINTTIINSNASWLSTYNATYVAINTTANIQNLLNSTGIYSTFNATYDNYATNVSYGDIFVNESGDSMSGPLRIHDASDYSLNVSGDFYVNGSSGNVGIGTKSPSARLHVNYDTSGDAIFQVGTGDGGSDMNINFGYNGYGWYWKYVGSQSGNDNELELWSEGAGSTDQQVYEIEQDGEINFLQNVGIGTSSPTHTLTVVGDLNVTGETCVGSGCISGFDVLNQTAMVWSVNTTANIQNLLNSTGIYSTYNATYDAYAYNVSLNYTQRVFDNWNDDWISTYNATYALYNDTTRILSVNTTKNIQSLLNSTGIYSTYNATYDNYATNVSYGDIFINETGDTMTGPLRIDDTSDYSLNVSGVLYVNGTSGRVGVGTWNPNSTLEVQQSANAFGNGIRLTNTNNNNWEFAVDNLNNLWLGYNSGSSAVMYWDGSGRVGIGTDSPNQLLDISGGNIIFDNAKYFYFRNSTGDNDAVGIWRAAGNALRIRYKLNSLIFDALDNKTIIIKDAEDNNRILFNVEGNSYFNGGNVGIGTSSPNYKLSTAGNIESVSSAPYMILNETDNTHSWFIVGDSNRFDIRNGSVATSAFLSIADDGKVGIGTTSPISNLNVGVGGVSNTAIYGNYTGYGVVGKGGIVGVYGASNSGDAGYMAGDFYVSGTCMGSSSCDQDIAEKWVSEKALEHIHCGEDRFDYLDEEIDEEMKKGYQYKCVLDSDFESEFENGDVVCFKRAMDSVTVIDFCEKAYDKKALSTVSYNATIKFGPDYYPYPVSLAGNVPMKVICDNPIEVGDPLVTSDIPGYAMKLDISDVTTFQEFQDRNDAVFAKALEPCDSGRKIIRAWV